MRGRPGPAIAREREDELEDYVPAQDLSAADAAARLRAHVQDRLNLLEKNGHCQVCNTTQWVLLSDATAQNSAAQLPGWPTYALACGTCGFVRHHLKSIFDGSGGQAYAAGGAARPGSRGDEAAPLDAKVAVLERIAASTDDLLAELRWDVRAMRCKQEDDYRSLAERMAEQAGGLSATVSGATRRLYFAGGMAVLGVVCVMAKGFRWF